MTDWHDTSTPVGRIRSVLDSGSFVVPASVLTVDSRVYTAGCEASPHWPLPAARTDEAEADPAQYTDTQAGVVVADSDSIDAGSVEHTRQSRLRAWQEQRP